MGPFLSSAVSSSRATKSTIQRPSRRDSPVHGVLLGRNPREPLAPALQCAAESRQRCKRDLTGP